MMLQQRPLCTTDFIDNLSLQDVTYKDDKLVRKLYNNVVLRLEHFSYLFLFTLVNSIE